MKFFLILFVTLSGWQLACLNAADDQAKPARNIILFVTDDQGPTLGCYGDPIAVTPNVDALAADGTRFTNAFATTASGSASRSVILSGIHNHKNGQYGHQDHFNKFASYQDVVALSLPQVLSRQGYRTARIGKFDVAPERVYHFGAELKANHRNPVLMAEACRDFIEKQDDDRPFFLYFATADPQRSGAVNRRSELELKPDLFGNMPNRGQHLEVEEAFYEPKDVPVPNFLPDTTETREELAQYYQSCSRIDQGLGRLMQILKDADLYDNTLILFTSDHGFPFAGAKTTVYDAGLRVPFVVHNPYAQQRGVVCQALISHLDITPSLLDFAGGLDASRNGPRDWINPNEYWQQQNEDIEENRAGGNQFRSYQGKSWLGILGDETAEHHEQLLASHTFHEITMYYPMRAIRDRKYKLIWNIAWKLDFPIASDLLAASSWQAQYKQGPNAPFGKRTVQQILQRPEFELYDMAKDPDESLNLADEPGYWTILEDYKKRLRALQFESEDPWHSKWEHE